MSAIYGFASRLSGCMAGLCAILALLALPSPSRADTLSDCQACCREKGFVDQELSACVGNCMQGSGPCAVAPCSTYNKSCAPNVPNDTKEECMGRTCGFNFCGCAFSTTCLCQ